VNPELNLMEYLNRERQLALAVERRRACAARQPDVRPVPHKGLLSRLRHTHAH